MFDAYKTANKNYKNEQSKTKSIRADQYGIYQYKTSIQKSIADVIGAEFKSTDSFEEFAVTNIDNISENWSKISSKIKDNLKALYPDIDEGELKNIITQTRDYFDIVQSGTQRANDALDSFKQTLTLVPQLSDAYENLSGSQLTFVNEYVSSLEIANDLSI